MKMKSVLVFLASVGSLCASEFVSLFNGKDFEGWGGKGKTEQAGYIVKDGVIESTKVFSSRKRSMKTTSLSLSFSLLLERTMGWGFTIPGREIRLLRGWSYRF